MGMKYLDNKDTISEAGSPIYSNKSNNYKTGRMIYSNKFDENRWDECSSGIHFFMTQEEAEDFVNHIN